MNKYPQRFPNAIEPKCFSKADPKTDVKLVKHDRYDKQFSGEQSKIWRAPRDSVNGNSKPPAFNERNPDQRVRTCKGTLEFSFGMSKFR